MIYFLSKLTEFFGLHFVLGLQQLDWWCEEFYLYFNMNLIAIICSLVRLLINLTRVFYNFGD